MSERLTDDELRVMIAATQNDPRPVMQDIAAFLRELAERRAADAQPAPDVDAVLLRDSRDIETATGRACPSCGFAHVTEGASKSHDWYCNHCQSYGNWDGSV